MGFRKQIKWRKKAFSFLYCLPPSFYRCLNIFKMRDKPFCHPVLFVALPAFYVEDVMCYASVLSSPRSHKVAVVLFPLG